MRFIRQDVLTEQEAAQVGQFDVAFYGRDDLDDRSRHSAALTRAAAKKSFHVRYDPSKFSLTVGDEVFKVDDLQDLFRRFRAQSLVIDATTMEIHYTKHHTAYIKNVNEAIAAEKITFGSEKDFFANASKLSAKARNNGGGAWNHNFFWQVMKPGSSQTTGSPGPLLPTTPI